MKPNRTNIFLSIAVVLLTSWKLSDPVWEVQKHKGYTLLYTTCDKENRKEYNHFIGQGLNAVKDFFHASFHSAFNVYVHPDRHSLDSTWQRDWKMPDFHSECWMVASGVAAKLDIISPKRWDALSCEHKYAEITKTQQLITHELVHIYHGQLNASPDFSDTEGLDWFVEGLATYASGQLDSAAIAQVKKLVAENRVPKGLNDFWTGKFRYGLSGSVVQFIDHKYGREKLKELLPYNKKKDLLQALGTTETDLLIEWKLYLTGS